MRTVLLKFSSICSNFIKHFICLRSIAKGEWGEKYQEVSTWPFHIDFAEALTSENHCSHLGSISVEHAAFAPRCAIFFCVGNKSKEEK